MKVRASCSIARLFDTETVNDYKAWKERRSILVSNLGRFLLQFNEIELTALYASWDSELKEKSNSESVEMQMSCMLIISVQHYFRRSFDQINKFFPIVNSNMRSTNRELARIAGQMLSYLMKESSDNAVFLREGLETAKLCLQPANRKELLFNALFILKKIGKFFPTDVFGVTLSFFPEIWNASLSKDKAERLVAVKVIDIHMRHVPSHTAKNFAESLFIDCMSKIGSSQRSDESVHGPVLVCAAVYRCYPDVIKVEALIEKIGMICHMDDVDATIAAFELILLIAESHDKSFNVAMANHAVMLLISNILKGLECRKHIRILKRLLAVVDKDNLPTSSIIEMVQFMIKSPSFALLTNVGFGVLYVLVKNDPTTKIPVSIFEEGCLCKNYAKALIVSNVALSNRVRDKLLDFFKLVGQNGTSPEDLSVIILLARGFPSIFGKPEYVFSQIYHLIFSNHECLRYSMVETCAALDTDLALEELYRLAAYDQSKRVRLLAVKKLKGKPIPTWLASSLFCDRSYEVRRHAISAVAAAAKINPFEITPLIVIYIGDFIANQVSQQDPSSCAKHCSLLPLIARDFVQFNSTSVPSLAFVCVSFLLRGNAWLDVSSENDLRRAVHRDFLDNHFHQVPDLGENAINLGKVYQIENEHFLEKRDVALFQTLGYLAEYLDAYLEQILPVYEITFSGKQTNNVYLAALNSLQSIVKACGDSRTWILEAVTRMYKPLMSIITTCSVDVAVSIFQLAGMTGAAKSIVFGGVKDDDSVEHMFAMKNPSYFTSFVIKSLINMMASGYSPMIFEAITHAFVEDTSYALPFLEPVLHGFVKAIEFSEAKQVFYSMLEVIIRNCQLHVVPFIPLLLGTLRSDFAEIGALRVCCALSFYSGVEFTHGASTLYPVALHYFDHSDIPYFKVLLSFLTHVVAFQKQDFGAWLYEVEERLDTLTDKRISIVLKHFSVLLQRRIIGRFGTRLAQICFQLIRNGKKSDHVDALLIDLCVFGNGNPGFILKFCKQFSYSVPRLSEIIDTSSFTNPNNISFIRRRKLELTIEPQYELAPQVLFHVNPFQDLPNVVFNNARQWIDELCTRVVTNSPSPSIRACAQVMNQSQSFKSELFPVAFLSCWRTASEQDQKAVSNIIKMIFENFEEKVPDLINLAEFLDRSGCPLLFTDDVLAAASDSTSFSLFFLQRYLLYHPGDKNAIHDLLKLNSKMGRIDAARGLLTSAAGILDQADEGQWSEELGEWEKALEIYERQENSSSLLKCYGHLELWDRIRGQIAEFETMTEEEKRINAIWFAWAFYHSNDYQAVKKFLEYFKDECDFNSILFRSLFSISIGDYHASEISIKQGFQELTKNLSIYTGSDANRATKNMVFAQHLVELQEVLTMKSEQRPEIPKLWQSRLRGFSHESDAWTRLIEIRSLVLSPVKDTSNYLKMLSVLRKERRWRLIDGYLERFFSSQSNLDVLISRLKTMWARGLKDKAALLMTKANELVSGGHIDFDDLSEDDRTLLLGSVPNDVKSLSDQTRARMWRLQATWQYQLDKGNCEVCDIFQKSNALVDNDYRTWAGWAYANSAISKKTPTNVLNAIKGFLRAARLRPSDSLEYLCQMFSIFFRYGDDFESPSELISEIVSLPASIMLQIIPQIVVHIAHKSASVRQVVLSIIETLASKHVQAVVFPLNVLSLVDDVEKATAAKNIMNSLSSRNTKMFEDLLLFIDGMHHAAVSLAERWLSAIDSASHAFRRSDKASVITITSNIFARLQTIQCEHDREFVRQYNSSIQRMRVIFDKFKNGDTTAARPLWDTFRSVYAEFEEYMRKTDTIQLGRISEELAKKRGFSFAIPGTYSADDSAPLLDHIEPLLQVLGTQQHPRCIFLTDVAGKSWKFLLKGNEDLRLDQRIMQFFKLINSLLKSNRVASDRTVSIVQYAVTPFALDAGLISWVTGADTFQQLVSDFRTHRNIKRNLEQELCAQFAVTFNSLSSIQKYEVVEVIEGETKGNELRETLWLRSPTPSAWLQRNRNFTVSTALMSMAGYTIGLGDRHPSNIMIQRHTGRVIHIDFGDSFEVALSRQHFAERVPFRMTRMIVNALDGGSVEGLFRNSCEDVLYILRENQSSIAAQLEVFVHEPMFSGKAIRSPEQARKILERVVAKLSGKDPIRDGETQISVDQQVDRLIKSACNKREYVRHFVGWCPFW